MPRDKRLGVKEVIEELGVSRTTFWRARAGLHDFPEPLKIGGLLYWRPSQLDAVEQALNRFRGRCKFEAARRHTKLVTARDGQNKARRSARLVGGQPTLFDD